jgi:hypothetical protein
MKQALKVVVFVVVFFALLGAATPYLVNECGNLGLIALPFVWLAFSIAMFWAFDINPWEVTKYDEDHS